MAKNNNPQTRRGDQQEPKAVPGRAAEPFLPSSAAATQSYVDQQFSIMKESLQRADAVSFFIIVILTVGFVTLLVAVIAIALQAGSFNALTQSDITKTLEKQNVLIEKINESNQEIRNALLRIVPSNAPNKD